MKIIYISLVLFYFCASLTTSAQPAPQEKYESALSAIRTTARDICSTPPMTNRENKIELSAEARATFAGLLKKLTDLGASGAAKYTSSESQAGLLRSDIVAALKDQNTCRLEVFRTLERKLLTEPIATSKPEPAPGRISFSVQPAEIDMAALRVGEPLITEGVLVSIRFAEINLGAKSLGAKWATISGNAMPGAQVVTFKLTGSSWTVGTQPAPFSESCDALIQISEGATLQPVLVLRRNASSIAIATCSVRRQ